MPYKAAKNHKQHLNAVAAKVARLRYTITLNDIALTSTEFIKSPAPNLIYRLFVGVKIGLVLRFAILSLHYHIGIEYFGLCLFTSIITAFCCADKFSTARMPASSIPMNGSYVLYDTPSSGTVFCEYAAFFLSTPYFTGLYRRLTIGYSADYLKLYTSA